MKFRSLISLVIFLALFFVSCGGSNTEGGTATSETSCVNNGAFNCKDNALMQCENNEWQKIEQCGEDQKCNAVKGICENIDSTPENPDTDDADSAPNQETDTDSSDTKPENPDTDDADPSTDDGDTEAVEINDEASCLAAGGAWSSGKCTKSVSCTGLPENAVWNKATGVRQTWNGTEWVPSETGTYSETPSTSECVFKCKTNYKWNAETETCEGASRSADCTELPANAQWNTVSEITQTWSGSEWLPSTSGIYSESASEDECRFKCATNYTWNGSSCAADTRTADCSSKPVNSIWNDNDRNGKFTQTWNGTDWAPASYTSTYNKTAGICTYTCDTGYIWSENQCITAPTQTASCTGLPANAEWNTATSITQTYDGSTWYPSTTGVYNTTSSTSECRFGCNMNYNWNSSTSKCDAATQQANCSSKPANTVWNDNGANGKFTQTWNGSAWNPASYTSTYNTTAGTCRYKCSDSYHTENGGASCISNTKTGVACTGLPSNAQWNTASSITQTWNGSSWTPTTTGTYNTTASTSQCRYKCKDGYHTEDSGASCISNTKTGVACTGLPSNAQWNTASSITQTWNGSAWTPTATGSFNNTASTSECRFKCNTNYNWNSSNKTCDAAKQTVNCSTKPANTVWNTVSTVTQTWTGSAWSPSNTSTYNTTASTNACRYKCDDRYFWNGTKCIASLGRICTGQTKCYDNDAVISCPTSENADFFGQDSQYTSRCVPHSFTIKTISEQNVIVDNNTGLEWTQTRTALPFEDAKNYCDNLNYAGYDDWRLPNLIDFYTILDNGKNPAFDTNYFQSFHMFWTSQEDASYLYIITEPAYTHRYTWNEKNYYLGVVCVRGNKLPLASFKSLTINGNVVVTDSVTGLMWQKTYTSSKYNWKNALKYCENLNYAGYSDWRLPNKNELASLLNYEKSAAPYSDFPDMPNEYFWSSSTSPNATQNCKYAWYVEFSGINVSYGQTLKEYDTRFVRCVRN